MKSGSVENRSSKSRKNTNPIQNGYIARRVKLRGNVDSASGEKSKNRHSQSFKDGCADFFGCLKKILI